MVLHRYIDFSDYEQIIIGYVFTIANGDIRSQLCIYPPTPPTVHITTSILALLGKSTTSESIIFKFITINLSQYVLQSVLLLPMNSTGPSVVIVFSFLG